LRKAFESALRNAGLDLQDQEFLIGHIIPGAQDTYYDKTKVEDLRRKYAKVNFFDRSIEFCSMCKKLGDSKGKGTLQQ